MRHALATALLVATCPIPLSAPAHAATVTCHGHVATIVGTKGDDHLVGTDGRDVIVGLGGADVIDGLGGDDVLCGGTGFDQLHGGPGADVLGGGRHTDWLFGGGGDDLLIGGRSEDELYADAGDDTYRLDTFHNDRIEYGGAPGPIDAEMATGTITGWGHDTVTPLAIPVLVVGSAYDDHLQGSETTDYFTGGPGDDIINGAGGDDEVDASPGNDAITGGAGNDTFFLDGTGYDHDGVTVDAGPGDDLIYGFGTHDVVHGGTGADLLEGWVGMNDTQVLDGGPESGNTLWVGRLTNWGTGPTPVTIDLTSQTVTAHDTSETFSGITNVTFEVPNDPLEITGTDDANVINLYNAGPATVHALGGDDVIKSLVTTAATTIDGGDGTDSVDARGSDDTCTSVEQGIDGSSTGCEVSNP